MTYRPPYNDVLLLFFSMLLLVLGYLLFSGCAGVNQRHMDRQYLLTKHAFEKTTGAKVHPEVPITIVRWYQGSLECEYYEGGTCSGTYELTPLGWRINLKAARCVPESAWTHELIHTFAYEAYGDPDRDHERGDLWRGANSVEHRSRAAGVYEGMCGP